MISTRVPISLCTELWMWSDHLFYVLVPSSSLQYCFDLPCAAFKRETEKRRKALVVCQGALITATEMKLRHHPSHPVAIVTPKSAYCEGQRLFVPNTSQPPQSPIAVGLHTFATNICMSVGDHSWNDLNSDEVLHGSLTRYMHFPL